MINKTLEEAVEQAKARLSLYLTNTDTTFAREVIVRLVRVIEGLERQSLEDFRRNERLRELEEDEWRRKQW